mmetsp:Transcript_5564/g.6281  ORF Transcript_5564/g.6281 Transcript_5564/m.6281 type:complete len:82 (-) Transcript_5564:1-246(-)
MRLATHAGKFATAQGVPFRRDSTDKIHIATAHEELVKAFMELNCPTSPSATLEGLKYDDKKNRVWKRYYVFGKFILYHIET